MSLLQNSGDVGGERVFFLRRKRAARPGVRGEAHGLFQHPHRLHFREAGDFQEFARREAKNFGQAHDRAEFRHMLRVAFNQAQFIWIRLGGVRQLLDGQTEFSALERDEFSEGKMNNNFGNAGRIERRRTAWPGRDACANFRVAFEVGTADEPFFWEV